MKNFPLLASVLFMMLFVSVTDARAQRIRGSQNVVNQQREVPFFDAVRVGGSVDLYITQGEAFVVEVIADHNLLDYLETTVEQGVLVIGMKPRLSIRGYKQLQVHVTAPHFTSIQASGSSDVYANGVIMQESLKIKASGSSDVRMEIDVKNLEIQCSGSSDAILGGYAQSVQGRFSGSSDLKARNLKCIFAELELSGSSDATLNIQQEVMGSLRGSSDLRIIGSPAVKVKTSGSSSIKTGS